MAKANIRSADLSFSALKEKCPEIISTGPCFHHILQNETKLNFCNVLKIKTFNLSQAQIGYSSV